MFSSDEEPILILGDLNRSRAFLVIVRHVIDPRAYGIATHNLGIVRLQQFRDDLRVIHARIEPEIVTLWVEDDWHSVVGGRGHGVRRGGQDRAGFNPIAACILPAVPQSRESE